MKKELLDYGCWHLIPAVWISYDMINPPSYYATSYSCYGTDIGWNCDPGMLRLVAQFEVETDPAKRKASAEEMQLRVLDQAPAMFLG
jgi:peptide/nickel transport system substrate-binding protein